MKSRKDNRRAIHNGVCLILAALVLKPWASAAPRDPGDPLQGFNRKMYEFNDVLDRHVLKPLAKGYQLITPEFVAARISNFFSNIGEITVVINELLQLKFTRAVSDTGRFATNSTVGLGGLFDVAGKLGMQKHNEDFGQTLGWWGVGSGPYLVLPFLGPSDFRDGPAQIVDALTDPLFYVNEPVISWSLFTVNLISTRAELLKVEEFVDEVAYDRYVTIRNAYLDNRRFLVYDGNPPEDDFFKEMDEEPEGTKPK